MRAPDATDEQVVAQLRTLTVAKELFESRWYATACENLGFDHEVCRNLLEMGTETRDERLRVERLVEEWAGKDVPVDAPERVATVTRIDFLAFLIQSKNSAGEALERAANVAPARLRERLLELAAVDFRHSNRLRELLRDEVDRLAAMDSAAQS